MKLFFNPVLQIAPAFTGHFQKNTIVLRQTTENDKVLCKRADPLYH